MDALRFLIVALGVYRVSRMMTHEEGPFMLFSRFRDWLGQTSWVGRGFHCILCLSFWLALPATFLLSWNGVEGLYYWLGLAGAVAALYKFVEG